MKTLWSSLVFFLIQYHSIAATKTVAANTGQGWNVASNWSPAGVPVSGDSVVIPVGKTITVKGNIYNSAADLFIRVLGTLDFEPSGKLNLSNASALEVLSGGQITSDANNSEVIFIGGVTKYQGGVDASPLHGPVYANSSSGSSPSGFINGTILPVKLKKISAQVTGQLVQLQWSTADESGLSHFNIEKSQDALQWQSIKTLSGKGAGSLYTITDKTGNGIFYYRLKTTELDGAIDYSNHLKLQVGAPLSLTAIPNPASGWIKIFLPDTNAAFQLQLRNTMGQLVQQLITPPHSVNAEMDVSRLQKGIYNLQMLHQGQPVASQMIFIH